MDRLSGALGAIAEPFSCAVETRGDHVVVRPFGELDCSTIGGLEQQLRDLRAAGPQRIELDLGSVSFLDSTAVRLVFGWSQADAAFTVRGGSPAVHRLFEIMALTHLLSDPRPV